MLQWHYLATFLTWCWRFCCSALQMHCELYTDTTQISRICSTFFYQNNGLKLRVFVLVDFSIIIPLFWLSFNVQLSCLLCCKRWLLQSLRLPQKWLNKLFSRRNHITFILNSWQRTFYVSTETKLFTVHRTSYVYGSNYFRLQNS